MQNEATKATVGSSARNSNPFRVGRFSHGWEWLTCVGRAFPPFPGIWGSPPGWRPRSWSCSRNGERNMSCWGPGRPARTPGPPAFPAAYCDEICCWSSWMFCCCCRISSCCFFRCSCWNLCRSNCFWVSACWLLAAYWNKKGYVTKLSSQLHKG